jgi:hypothetical protein
MTHLLPNTCETTSFATLVYWVNDPVDSGITPYLESSRVSMEISKTRKKDTHSFMVRVNKDDFVVLVDTILIDPVRVHHSQISAPPANTLLRRAPQTTLELQVVNTLTNRFAVGGTCAM